MPGASDSYDMVLVGPPPYLSEGPPLNLACLSAYLAHRGLRAKILDLNIELYHHARPELRELWEWEKSPVWERKEILLQLFRREIEHAVDRILEVDTEVVALSISSRREPAACEIIKAMAERGARRTIILGGPACLEQRTHRLLQWEVPGMVDALVLGEGERALVDLLEAHRAGRLGPRGPEPQVVEGTRTQIECLDELPVPDLEQLDLALYRNRLLFVEWSRGCIARCAFCQIGALWPKYRRKSPRRIHAEMEELARRTGISIFSACDSLIDGDVPALLELCDLLLSRPLHVQWTGSALPRRGMDAALVRKMAASGCFRLEIGVESGSDRVLRAMRKTFSVSQAETFLADLKEAGIMTAIYLIAGFPGETERDFAETLAFLRRNASRIDLVRSANTLSISEHTPLARHPARFGLQVPAGKMIHPYKWVDALGTPLEVRNQRVRNLIETCQELGIQTEKNTLMDTQDAYELLAEIRGQGE